MARQLEKGIIVMAVRRLRIVRCYSVYRARTVCNDRKNSRTREVYGRFTHYSHADRA